MFCDCRNLTRMRFTDSSEGVIPIGRMIYLTGNQRVSVAYRGADIGKCSFFSREIWAVSYLNSSSKEVPQIRPRHSTLNTKVEPTTDAKAFELEGQVAFGLAFPLCLSLSLSFRSPLQFESVEPTSARSSAIRPCRRSSSSPFGARTVLPSFLPSPLLCSPPDWLSPTLD